MYEATVFALVSLFLCLSKRERKREREKQGFSLVFNHFSLSLFMSMSIKTSLDHLWLNHETLSLSFDLFLPSSPHPLFSWLSLIMKEWIPLDSSQWNDDDDDDDDVWMGCHAGHSCNLFIHHESQFYDDVKWIVWTGRQFFLMPFLSSPVSLFYLSQCFHILFPKLWYTFFMMKRILGEGRKSW